MNIVFLIVCKLIYTKDKGDIKSHNNSFLCENNHWHLIHYNNLTPFNAFRNIQTFGIRIKFS